MHLVLGDRRFDVRHRALVVGLLDDVRPVDEALVDRPDALAATSWSVAASLCDRVDVPVGVLVSPQQLEFAGERVDCVGPFAGAPPQRFARVAEAVVAGARVVVSTEVRSDRRVVEVLARILAAKDAS